MFPPDLKLVDVTPVYKNKSKNSKDNYRPVIKFRFSLILFCPNIRFQIGYNAQHCLITLIEKRKKSIDGGGTFGVLFTNLSEAFDCLSHGLLIVRLDAYGLDKNTLIVTSQIESKELK